MGKLHALYQVKWTVALPATLLPQVVEGVAEKIKQRHQKAKYYYDGAAARAEDWSACASETLTITGRQEVAVGYLYATSGPAVLHCKCRRAQIQTKPEIP